MERYAPTPTTNIRHIRNNVELYRALRKIAFAFILLLFSSGVYFSSLSLLKPTPFDEENKNHSIALQKVDSLNVHLKKHKYNFDKNANVENGKKLKMKVYVFKHEIFKAIKHKKSKRNFCAYDTVILKSFKVDTSMYIPITNDVRLDTDKLKIIVKKIRYGEDSIK